LCNIHVTSLVELRNGTKFNRV